MLSHQLFNLSNEGRGRSQKQGKAPFTIKKAQLPSNHKKQARKQHEIQKA